VSNSTDWNPKFASGAGLPMFSLSIPSSLIKFLLDRVAVVTFITPGGRNIKQNLKWSGGLRQLAGLVPFLRGDKISQGLMFSLLAI
jgi:hypothetical protein